MLSGVGGDFRKSSLGKFQWEENMSTETQM